MMMKTEQNEHNRSTGHGYTMILEDRQPASGAVYRDSPLPGTPPAGNTSPAGASADRNRAYPGGAASKETSLPNFSARRNTVLPGTAGIRAPQSAALSSAQGERRTAAEPDVPERIRHMLRLYEYGDNSFRQKCLNFLRQGRDMEDYEDDVPWDGEFRRYFPTYHDLSVKQLRGYFTWRTAVRKGRFGPIATSIAYLYIYELLCGIGTSSPEDALGKMEEFEAGFLDAGYGDDGMRKNLQRWKPEYAILHRLPAEKVREYIAPEQWEKDMGLVVLKNPAEYSDEEVFSALLVFSGKSLLKSPLLMKEEHRGKHLFASVWRMASEQYCEHGRNLFTACFGEKKVFPWYPLANSVHWEEDRRMSKVYVLNDCRRYICRACNWWEERYESLFFGKDLFQSLLHAADRLLRAYAKTGRYLKEKPGEAWAVRYVEAALELEEEEARKAPKQEIRIDFDGLEQIRLDSMETRDSLLTEEEMGIGNGAATAKKQSRNGSAAGHAGPAAEAEPAEDACGDGIPAPAGVRLDPASGKILYALLRGEAVGPLLKAGHLMASVVADTVNEAFFDEIGDNVLACDGEGITVVEDYREELEQLLQG